MTALARARGRAPGILLLAALATGVAAQHHQQAPDAPKIIAPGYAALNYEAPIPGSYRLPPLGAAADGDIVDSSGAQRRLHQAFGDGVTLLAFIYTSCDDVNGCPLATFVMAQVARRLQADPVIRERLKLVSYSFDIAHDTPAVLSRYAESFRPDGARWDFVTAPDADTLRTTLAAYQQTVQQTGGHAFSHILRVFLVDGEQRIRNIYSTAFLHADTVAADIRTLLMEQGALASAPAPAVDAATTRNADDPLLGLPPLTAMPGPQPTAAQAALGARLFFDRRLSLNRTLSCAMCHVPAQGFAVNELATAVGIEGRTVKRNAPTLLNVGWLGVLFHDARENRLEQQVWAPLLASNEMGNPSIGYVLDNLRHWSGYAAAFEEAFGTGIGMESVGAALAAYQRTLVAGGSPFDRWHYGGDETAVDAAAKRGFALFRGKAGCVACHSVGPEHALFTDQQLHNTGLGYRASMAPDARRRLTELAPGVAIEYDLSYVQPSAERKPNDLGRYEVTQDPADRWKYRTAPLRNVALTAPYMHDGSLATLAEVVAFYDRGGIPNEGLDPLVHPLGLSAAEQADLVAFLESLTSPAVARLVDEAQAIEVSNPRVE
ncbi:MAG: SCO family protein [Gammaproteobacteria bacterium]|nr:SCO family protein [Gammaproteobacteria bacterium]